ncbi:trichohyalin-like [Ceratina calcarata]|uniref:Trichohyalin-like n=1 Tax=Ceratina calcarata TaxID=156304 RepID=A0AAJ7RZ47_9HYME|nr:trichohyalin-like [Ceratina calcarata]
MVGRYREKDYQRAAQRHNEEFLKYDYYQQIATYFERECRIAKHYDSWNYRNLDPKGELAKAKKAEKLQIRRSKLRKLLKEEDETYRRELEERKKVKIRPEESSLELLKQRLREKRAEQSLYLPRTCRRYQSYFVCPKEPNNPCWNTTRDTDPQLSRVCRDSTNFIHRNGLNSYRRSSTMSETTNKSFREQEKTDSSQDVSSPNSSEGVRPNSRYSTRYAHKSLENTNVRGDDPSDHPPNEASSRSSLGLPSDKSLTNGDVRSDDKENRTEDAVTPGSDQTDSKKSSAERSIESETSRKSEAIKRKDTRQFEVEKSLPWLRMDPGDKNLSKQMFLYLTHKELKCKIEDLAKRETHACNKQCWDEALRLRDMRNKLELNREKKLYSMDTLDIDEESRELVLVNIGKREAELNEREKVCMDSTMYSEDAKALWKKWLLEDERSVIKDARQQREKLMNSLEKEWQNLAIREKERISRSYQSVMNDSALQEEHKLSAAINASRMKSVSSSLKY